MTEGKARAHPVLVFVLLIGGLAVAVVLATAVGVVKLPWSETAKVIASRAFRLPFTTTRTYEAVIWSVRLPRVLMAGLVGFGLGVSGGAMQGLFRNPLASPDIIGVSSGGSMGAVIAIFLGLSVVHPWSVPIAAFLFALVASVAAYGLATRSGVTDVASLLLAGVALSSFFGAVISLLYHFVEDGVLRQIVYWLMGNLNGKRWDHVALVAPLIALGSGALFIFSRELNMLAGGDEDAASMGVAVQSVKRWVLVAASLTTGAAVSVVGIIGFVGLIVPHMMRFVTGPDHRVLLPASGLFGASFLILCDLIARVAFSPVELRTGIVTAFFGVPFFLYLLLKRRELVAWH